VFLGFDRALSRCGRYVPDMSDRLLVLAHAGFTLAMTGFLLAVQLVVYPQFRSVDEASFPPYAADHAGRIVVGLAVLAPAEVLLALWLFVDTPAGLSRGVVFLAGLLLAVAWVATGLWYAPLHGRLQESWDPEQINLLIYTNWIRTGLWAARSFFALFFLWQIVEPSSV